MKIRFVHSIIAAVVVGAFVAPAALAADLSDVGYIDQGAIAGMPAFAAADKQLASYENGLHAQFASAIKGAKTDADKQRISLEFQQKLSDKQRELVGPLLTRAQLAIAQVSSSKNLSVVVDKRIVVYGGQDITKDVANLLRGSQAIAPPAASPPPSEIGFVDQTSLDSLPKVRQANKDFSTFAQAQRKIFEGKLTAAKTDADKQQVAKDFNKTLADKQDALLKPLVDQTKSVTADIAKQKNLLLVIDRADVIYGGTDITKDVQDALSK